MLNLQQMFQNLLKSNPQAQGIANQFNMMTKEQQAQKIADMCNEKGITLDQIKMFMEMEKQVRVLRNMFKELKTGSMIQIP